MGWQVVCDGCGKSEPSNTKDGKHTKPDAWMQKKNSDGTISDACSPACAQAIDKKEMQR